MEEARKGIKRFKRLIREIRDITAYKRLMLESNRKRPDFMIIGAAKCGTTSLFQYLAAHPEIDPPHMKEFKYFDMQNQQKGLKWYLESFPSISSEGTLTFEATPTYLALPNVPRQLLRLFPKLKLIVLLRDPIERAYSHWHWHRFSDYANTTGCIELRSFEKAIKDELNGVTPKSRYFDYLSRGNYAKQLSHWFEYFSPDHFLIIDSYDLQNNKLETLNQTADFLNLVKDFSSFQESNKTEGEAWKPNNSSDKGLAQYNVSRYSIEIDDKSRVLLEDYYKDANDNLEVLLNRRFSWSK